MYSNTKFWLFFLILGDVWVATTNGSAFVSWDEPVFADNVAVERVINKGGLRPGQALQWGTYDVAYVAYDEAGNTAQCDFKIYVLNRYVFIHYFKYYFFGRLFDHFSKH